MYLTLNKKISWNCFTFFSVRNHRIIIAKLQIEHDNKFSSVAEAKSYTGFIFKSLRARWLHVIRDFFLSVSVWKLSSLLSSWPSPPTSPSLSASYRHHHQKNLVHHPSTNNLSFFLPGEKYHIKARLASTRYFSSFILPPISSDRQAGTFSTLVSPTLIIIWCVSYNSKFSLADPYIHR